MDVATLAYAYPFASALVDGGKLRLATSGGDADASPQFFAGELLAPARAARLLTAVSAVAAERFYVPPAMLAAILLAADPVVTSDGRCLRFEALSACCGVYTRADLLPNALGASPSARGTTNVDFNAPMRSALSRVRPGQPLRLLVGDDGLELRRQDESVVERRVPLPRRWVRGLAEVQALQAEMTQVASVPGAFGLRFLRLLPRSATRGARTWVVAKPDGLRLAHAAVPGGVEVGGAHRLRTVEPAARELRELSVWSHPSGASGWVLHFDDARLQLVLSAAPQRGLSGEGALLEDALRETGSEARLLAAIRWHSPLKLTELADQAGLDLGAVKPGLVRLALAGLVGYDLAEAVYFARALPFANDDPLASISRLAGAHKLLDDDKVTVESRDGGSTRARVAGGSGEYLVEIGPEGATCTCRWFAAHGDGRGPCRHVLAVRGLDVR